MHDSRQSIPAQGQPPSPPLYDLDEVRRAHALLVAPGDVVELRVFDARLRGRWGGPAQVNGYTRTADGLCRMVEQLEEFSGAYLTINPCAPDLYSRRADVVQRCGKGEGTSDDEIVRRRWLFIDLDPERLPHISSTEAEFTASRERAQRLVRELRAEGWPEPVVACSGNGWHVLYRVDLPNDAGALALVTKCLAALQGRFGDEAVKVDQKVSNASRICKLYGTAARKGSHTPERPHRLSRIVQVPNAEVRPVPSELLEALAAEAPAPAAPAKLAPGGPGAAVGRRAWDLAAWVARFLPDAHGPADWQGGRRWTLPVCPFDETHARGEAYVVELSSGAIDAGCQHDSCRWGWRALRERIEPGCYDAEGADVAAARQTLTALVERVTAEGRPALVAALETPETVGALALVAKGDAAAYEGALLRLRDVKDLRGRDVAALERAVRAAKGRAAGLRVVGSDEGATGDGLPPGFVVPNGWVIRNGRLHETQTDGQGNAIIGGVVSERPPMLVGRFRDVETGERQLECEFSDLPAVTRLAAPRDEWMGAAGLKRLARRGLPVHEGNAKRLTSWLDACETANAERLSYVDSVTHLGWCGSHFVLGAEVIGPEGGPRFVPLNAREAQIVEALRSAGTFEAWRAGVLPIAVKYPRIMLAIVAAHATAIMDWIGAPSFCVEFCDQSSSGKTTATRIALSAWGRPDFDDAAGGRGASLASTFNTTRVGLERYLGVMGHGLPVVLDDSQQASDPKFAGDVVMMVGNELGRTRGAPTGAQATATWHTIAFVTGERGVEETSAFAGVSGRLLSFPGSPFGGPQREDVEALVDCVRQNYGHSGPALVRALLAERDARQRARDVFSRWRRDLAAMLPTDPINVRRRGYVATILTAAELLEPLLCWPLDGNQTATERIQELLVEHAKAQPVRDQTRESYRSFVSWCHERRARFVDASSTRSAPDDRDTALRLGVWDSRNRTVSVLTNAAQEWERESGYPLVTSARLWRDAGLLETDRDREHATRKVQLFDSRPRCYVVKLDDPEDADEE